MTTETPVERAALEYSTYKPNESHEGLNIHASDQYAGFKAGAAWALANDPVVLGMRELLKEAVDRLRWYDAEHETDFYARVKKAVKT